MEIKEIKESWRRIEKGLKLQITYAELIEDTFNQEVISHYTVAKVTGIEPDILAMDIVNTGWDGRITEDKGIAITLDLLHKILLHYVPLYRDSHNLSLEGILIYKNPLINEHFGYRKTPSIDLATLKGN